MLIINGDITKPKTEQQVVEWLANYVTHPGIAVSGVYVPRLDGGSTEAGLLVFTPHAVAVIEVDVLRKKARGPLSCSMNERWSAPGIHGDPVQLRGDDLNPLHQVRRPVSALRTFVAELTRGPEPFVDGLILLMPKSGSTLTLDKGPMPGGFTVLLGDSASQLYSWFGRTAQHRDRTPWTAELVVTVLTALRVDRTRDAESRRRLYADLVGEGFPTEVPAVRGDGDTDPTASSAAPSGAPTAQPDPAGQTEPFAQADPASSHIPPSQDESTPAAPSYISTPSGTPYAQPEMAYEVEANPQAVPTGSPIPPARTDSIRPFPSGTTAHTAPITTPQGDAPEPNWHEPAPEVDPRTQPPANHRLRTALLGIAASLILVCGIGYMAGNDHPRAQTGSQPAPSQVRAPERTTTPIPTSPVTPTERQGTSPRSTTPTEGATCYPFQAGC
ncbi:NERD domain-containing protein [Nocardia violaceofusca]|uniref:NERD domain-containing protein n=1 Tax=Nocardia violaceofusca TaxID=941182 RepID=UPI0007A53562|nr:NERD domain-containing protein [Nocardia violaceofusca]